MNVLVIQHADQHADVEHPGVFRDFFRGDGFRRRTVELDRGEHIPDLAPIGLRFRNMHALWMTRWGPRGWIGSNLR